MFAQFAKGFAKFGGILFDDAGERDDVNDALHTVPFGVFQRKCHGSESFAAAGRHGEELEVARGDAGGLPGEGEQVVDELLHAVDLTLTPDQIEKLETPYKPHPIVGFK